MGNQSFQVALPLQNPVQQTAHVLPHQSPRPIPSPHGQTSFSKEEIEDALQGDTTDHPDLEDNYMDLLGKEEEEVSTNPKMSTKATAH